MRYLIEFLHRNKGDIFQNSRKKNNVVMLTD